MLYGFVGDCSACSSEDMFAKNIFFVFVKMMSNPIKLVPLRCL